MDHRRIEELNIPDLYATGRLSTEDEEAFETHLLECRECREQVAWADDFGSSMRSVAVEEAARVSVHAGFLVWLSRRPVIRMALTAALLVLAALPAGLLVERSSLQQELARAQAAARPVPPAPQPSPVPQGPDPAMQAELNQLKQEKSRLVAELGREQKVRESLGKQIAALKQPQINTYTASLGVVRGTDDLGEVLLGSTPEFILLSVDPPNAERTYQVTVQDADGRTVWQGSGVKASSSSTLDILVHSDLLKPGEYRISLDMEEKEGRSVPAGEIGFLVRRKG